MGDIFVWESGQAPQRDESQGPMVTGLAAGLTSIVTVNSLGRIRYLRVRQGDGHLAWSSPVWVETRR